MFWSVIKVDIVCFQDTKWKGSSNKEGNGYKLWYSSSHTARNGVGIIVKACLKDKVVHMNRCSDMIKSLTMVIDGETVNVISTYAPQVGLSEEEKECVLGFSRRGHEGAPDGPTIDFRWRLEWLHRGGDGWILGCPRRLQF
nr:craniofacial development protein 2-like [Tanacetum cinerariifolium]